MSKRAFFSPAWLACLGVAWLALPALAAPTKVLVVVQNSDGKVLQNAVVTLKGQPLATKPVAASPAIFSVDATKVEFAVTADGFGSATAGMVLPPNDGLVNLMITLQGDHAVIREVQASAPTGSLGEAVHDAYTNQAPDQPVAGHLGLSDYSGPVHAGAGQTAGPAGCSAATILTHQTAPGTFDELSSVACGVAGSHTVENSYAQLFVIPAGGPLDLTCVDFVTSQQTVGTYTVDVNIYEDTTGSPPDVASMILLGTTTVDIPIDNIGIVSTADFSGQGISVASGSSLVFEIHAPDRDVAAGGDGGQFRVGSSGLAADGPSYILAAACGIADHLDTAAIGFPNSQWMYNVGFGAGGGGNPACTAGAGSCTDPAGTGSPGCDDIDCCNAVCAFDAFCCDVEWDGICAGETAGLPECAPPPPSGDTCDSCITVDAAGASGDTSDNAASGPFPSCGASTGPDEWLCYTAPADCTVTFDLCGSGFDTVLSAFSDCAGTELACNDDSCGLQSSITLAVTAGEVINLRVGGFGSGSAGAYVLNVTESCGPVTCGDDCVADNKLNHNNPTCSFANGTSVACAAGFTVINQYAQSFDLSLGATAGSAQTVECVDVGVSANDGSDYTIGVNIYEDTNGGAPNDVAGDLTLVCGTTVLVPVGTAGSMVTASFTGMGCTLPVDATLVVEVDAPTRDPAAGGDGGNFRMGSSGNPADGPSYLKSVDCGIADYVEVGAIGFPDSQWVENLGVNGGPPPPAACGTPGTGSCTDPAGTGSPFCDDLACCEAVCAFDPFCCDVEWDSLCAGETAGLPECAPPPSGDGDECTTCLPLAAGDTVDGTTLDNTGGVDDTSCAFEDTVDEWYCYTATCDGTATLSTCNTADFDTTIAVFDGCGGAEVGCNDDGPGCAGFTSSLTFPITAGVSYNVRISGFNGAAGNYTLSLTESCGGGGGDVCPLDDAGTAGCQTFATDNASQSNDSAFRSADDFQTLSAGSISSICWWGAYLPAPAPDAFVVTYYDSVNGLPGAVIGGPFTQGVDLTVDGPVDTGELVAGLAPIWEYHGTHAPVAVSGACYWVEVKNNVGGGTNWFWEWSFDGDLATVTDAGPDGYDPGDLVENDHDFAWCINLDLAVPDCLVPPPPICGPGAGACDVANGTPGCDDVPCCEAVCAVDPFCCDVQWDQICADESIDICQPIGACCQGAAGCSELNATDCAAAGGVYQGDNTVCTPDPCPPVGGCCSLGTCSVETQADCEAIPNAIYNGDGTDCSDNGPSTTNSANPGMAIPDANGPITHTIMFPESVAISDVDIAVGITHTWVGDLCVSVEHLGTTVDLIIRPGDPALDCTGGCCGCSADNYNIVLDDEAGSLIEDECVDNAFGNFIPESPLSAFDGMDSAGAWTITINDNAGGDTGTLDSWGVTVSEPGAPACEPVGACCGCPDEAVCDVVTAAQCAAIPNARYLGDGDATSCDLPPGQTTPIDSGGIFMAIPDANGPISHDLNMGMDFPVQDVNVGLNITHTWVGDLCVTVSHLGTDVVIIQRIGDPVLDCTGGCCGCSEDNIAATLDDSAAIPVDEACPAIGDFIPDNPLSAFNGMSSAGVWTISVNDNAGGDTGTLASWSLELTAPSSGGAPCEGECRICNNGIIEPGEDCDPGAADPNDCCDDLVCEFVASGSSCGSGPGICSGQDTCDGAGLCLPNHAPSGTLCGNPANECSDQDTCDGNGGCSSNDLPLGTACGNPADMPGSCFTGDSCSGGGVCIPGTIVTSCIDDDLCCNRSHGCSDENDNDCEADVPTVSTWGLLVLALLLAAAAKVYFGRRESVA
ncbi:MAG: IPTL-CTERM sorting domain-containing protein [Phycisphaerae bacterium]